MSLFHNDSSALLSKAFLTHLIVDKLSYTKDHIVDLANYIPVVTFNVFLYFSDFLNWKARSLITFRFTSELCDLGESRNLLYPSFPTSKFLFLASPHSMWDLSFPARDGTHAPSSDGSEL